MKFRCRHCKKIVSHNKFEISIMGTKRGYKSYCLDKGVNTYLIPVNLKKYNEILNKGIE